MLAAIAVLGALALIQGGDESTTPFEATQPAAEAPPSGPGGGARSDAADFVRQSSFSLALPAGWRRTGTARGATFTAAASDGEADVALWVERDPGLDFAAFETRSLEQLRALAGSAQVTERVAAPTVEGTIVRLAADNPPGSPRYEVTLRASGPYRYYLATTVQPGASRSAVEGAELIHGSFVPAGAGGKGG